MKASAKTQVHQLTNFEIHEVSLVDHAANKRRFLIAKRCKELASNGNSENPATAPGPPEAMAEAAATDHAGSLPAETNELLRELLVAVRVACPRSEVHSK